MEYEIKSAPILTDNETRANTQHVRDFRFRQRGVSEKKKADAAYAKSPRGLLERQWVRNWEAATDEEKAAVMVLHQRAVDALCEIQYVIHDLTNGASLPFVGVMYTELSAIPRSDWFPCANVAAHISIEEFNAFDDEPWKRYGKVTLIPQALWDHFLSVILQYARKHPDEFDEATHNELESLVPDYSRPAAAPAVGLRQPSKAEEQAAIRQRDHVRTVQERMAAGQDAWNHVSHLRGE
jgi:hypothetical protein